MGDVFLLYLDDRILAEANFIIEHNATVREAAKALCVGKSTVHKDVTERLRYLNPSLFRAVRTVLNTNKAERHLRGGKATHDKYAALRSELSDQEP